MFTERTRRILPSNTVTNLKEHVKVITLRSGWTYDQPQTLNTERDEEVAKNLKSEMKEPQSEVKAAEQDAINQQFEKIKGNKGVAKPKKSKELISETYSPSIYDLPIPFLQRSRKNKDILSKKRKLEEHETMMLINESSAILQKKLSLKLKDLGNFTIPYTIGNSYFDNALCDLGASINLMPLYIFRKLGLGEAKPTTISL
ncbi:hypothetical protein F2P56_015371 [Juglans regia]|uniref:Uncharacterized protein LOC108979430 n=2 Tax=Juglans regia TaxID=51240 RepID=A0A2I4DET3_JUGRE|nr:uncharacterized protein LOC108979430 [Juglans regia]KAF5465355.1 hypothetical protein F2P56_015371 [Juglans regia]